MTMRTVLRLAPLEIAAGFPIGSEEAAAATEGPTLAPIAALEQAIMPALERAPCVVSFSGGRDSSAVLALATRLARREGLPAPIPVTLRFPGSPAADESHWQECVVRHLGLDDWQSDEIADELDLVGPVATGVLQRHGLLWPPNTHFHQPILERARTGAALTGIDGDGIFASWRWARPARILRGRLRPRPRDAGRIALALAPPPLRRAIEIRRPGVSMPWLRPQAVVALHEARSGEAASEPARWDRWIAWYARRRAMRMVIEGFQLLADDAEVMAVHPFADPAFLAALASDRRWGGIGDRTAAMTILCGDLLPTAVLHRPSKAVLDAPFWNTYSRDFASNWDGIGGLDRLVDGDALRHEWLSRAPHACASTLLQAAWLRRNGSAPC